MDIAAGLALSSKMCQKVGCVIMQKGGKILAQSVNQTVGTKPAHSMFNNVSRHAEQGAMEAMLRRLRLLEQARLLLCEKVQVPSVLQEPPHGREAEEEAGQRHKERPGVQREDVRGEGTRLKGPPLRERKAVFRVRQVDESVRPAGN